MSSMHNWDVEAAPLIDPDAIPDSLCCNSENSRIVTNKDNTTSWRKSCLYDTNDIWNGQTREQWPHGEVLETSWRRRELVAESIILHVNTNEIVQSRCRETQNAGNLLSVE